MARRVALDTNCLIDLEENRPAARHIRTLIGAWTKRHIELAIVAVSASENQPSGTASQDFDVFEAKLTNIGLAGAHHLPPLALWDVFYWDHALWPSADMEALELTIRGILYPGIHTAPPANVNENSVWRNHMCDVLVAWSCIHHGWQSLVTRDKNFHNHRVELAALGLREVLYPADAAQAYVS